MLSFWNHWIVDRKGWLLLTSIVLSFSARAQLFQTDRYELEHKNSENAWTIISMKENGLAIVRERDKVEGNQRTFEIKLLDTLLIEKNHVEAMIPFRMKLIGYEYTPQYLYVLFRSGDNELSDFLVLEYEFATSAIGRSEIKHEFAIRPTHFTVLDRHAIMGGYVSREPAVLIYDIPNSQIKVVPGFLAQDTELLDLKVNENGTFNTLTTNRSARAKKTLHLRTFDATGVQLMEDEIDVDQNKTILSGLTSALVRDELLIAGTYATGNSKMATGFFSVLADPFKEQPIHYYDFAQLNHFLDYLSAKRAEKVRTISRRFREKSRDPEFRASVTNVKLEERVNGFYLLAETYNTVTPNNGPYPYAGGYGPGYSPYGYYPYSPFSSRYYNSPYTYSNQPVSVDYSILSTSVVAFSADGRLDWDHSLKVDDHRRPTLEQAADFWCNKNKIVIAAKDESELVVKSRFKNNESSGDTLKVITRRPNETIRDETKDDGGVRHWYGNRFYVWGYQSVRDPEAKDDKNRSVFYLIKANVY